jgi:uncharacterized membrane protein YhaH (DUF805 family)
MKRIDVQNAITKYLNSNKFTIIDSLSKQYTISSYEEYVECFTLIKNTYQNNIIEFNKEGKEFIEKMNSFITMTIQSVDDGSLENYVDNNLKSELGFDYYRSVNLISIYPKSFLLQRECSQEAFINVYNELGYDMLKEYINLVKSPSNFSSYINDSSRQIVAMKFLLFKTDHHSPKGFRRDTSAKTIYQETSNNLTESISAITKEKEDFINYMNEQKENYNNWFEDTSDKMDNFILNHSNELSNLEKTYEEKLKIEKPAEFMLEQANKYRNSFYWWCLAIVLLAIFLIILLAAIVSPQVTFNDKLITVSVLNKDMPVYSSIILLAMISLVVYILRIFIKMAVSSKHLMEEYKQKYSLTYFYLSLINNGNIKDEKAQNIILTSLFTKADTGLIKNDGSNEFDKTILSLLTK